jgi:hypothetical protein
MNDPYEPKRPKRITAYRVGAVGVFFGVGSITAQMGVLPFMTTWAGSLALFSEADRQEKKYQSKLKEYREKNPVKFTNIIHGTYERT